MKVFGLILSAFDVYLLGIAGTLGIIIIGAIIYRANASIIKRREQRTEAINGLLAPFNDAIVNIEYGQHNHIMIMTALYERQNESISKAKAITTKGKKKDIQKAWNDYEAFYKVTAKNQTIGMFSTIAVNPGSFKQILRAHIDTIIKAIKKI